MKKLLALILISFLIGSALSSCNKTDSDSSNYSLGINSSCYFKVTVSFQGKTETVLTDSIYNYKTTVDENIDTLKLRLVTHKGNAKIIINMAADSASYTHQYWYYSPNDSTVIEAKYLISKNYIKAL